MGTIKQLQKSSSNTNFGRFTDGFRDHKRAEVPSELIVEGQTCLNPLGGPYYPLEWGQSKKGETSVGEIKANRLVKRRRKFT